MKKIIVPIDFSEFSEHALQTAAFFAKKLTAQIIAVHLLEGGGGTINKSSKTRNQEKFFYTKLAEKKFKEFLNKEYLNNFNVKAITRDSKDFGELNTVAKEEQADLIIMGSHGAYGLKELLVGSNTEKVVRNATIPVLVTKGIPIISDFKTAVFACDFSEDDIEPYKKAKKLMHVLDCKMQLLYVNTPYGKFKSTKEHKQKLITFLEKADGNLNQVEEVAYISEYSVEEGILDFANVEGKDLIVMATHGKKGIEHFLDGSISEDVANHSTLPVLTFRI